MSQTKDFGHHLHGTRVRYQGGCRCGDCTVANTEYIAGLADRERLIPAEPWRRIIRTIAVLMDVEPARLIKGCGLNGATAAGIMTGRYRTITPHTHMCLKKLLLLLPTEGGD